MHACHRPPWQLENSGWLLVPAAIVQHVLEYLRAISAWTALACASRLRRSNLLLFPACEGGVGHPVELNRSAASLSEDPFGARSARRCELEALSKQRVKRG